MRQLLWWCGAVVCLAICGGCASEPGEELPAGMSAEEAAAYRGAVAALDGGDDPNKPDDQGMTLLHRAAEKGYAHVAELLVSRGADVNARGAFDRTPLHQAAGAGQTSLVTLLLEHGAEVNPKDKAGLTPMGVAMMRSKAEAAALLKARGATGTTPMMRAMAQARSVQCMSNLKQIGLGLRMAAAKSNGRTPETLSAVVDAGYLTAEVLRCPLCDGSRLCDYVYVPYDEGTAPPMRMVVCDIDGHAALGSKRNVLFADGHVEALSPADFEKRLAEPANQAFAAVFRETVGRE